MKYLQVKCAGLETDIYEEIILGNKVCSIKPNLSLARENIFCGDVELPKAEHLERKSHWMKVQNSHQHWNKDFTSGKYGSTYCVSLYWKSNRRADNFEE
ncbi:hypothetical protein GH733_015242, partial [Mirounga leonina]